MYSHEIEKFIKEKNYILDKDEYKKIFNVDNNPQIVQMKYDSYNDDFEMKTSDNYYFKVKVKNKKN